MLLKNIARFTNPFRGLPHEVRLLSTGSSVNRSGAMVICFLTHYLTEALHFTIKMLVESCRASAWVLLRVHFYVA